MNKDKDENEECFDLKQIHSNLKKYIQGLIPNADIISEFNGNFSYLIPYEGFNASYVYTQIESNKKKLRIQDWGLSQSTLEDVFTKIVENSSGSGGFNLNTI